MAHAAVYSRAHVGISAPLVRVEAHITGGAPSFGIVGLPETAVKESRDRVRAAILNSQYEFYPRRIIVNLSPADLPKSGSHFDLAIAMSVLLATEQIKCDNIDDYEFLGELALSGNILPGRGVLPCADAIEKAGRILLTGLDNLAEAQLCEGLKIYPVRDLLAVGEHFAHTSTPIPVIGQAPPHNIHTCSADMSDVLGQPVARRALEIAASGGHSMLMSGPPGTGKSMLASRLPSILPTPTNVEALEIAMMASICGQFAADRWAVRPFHAPHHTASAVALVGGGSIPRPGEISRAHQGVLFLDELPEFNRHVLETLREPLETRRITISRAARQTTFPAAFQLIAAMNPCPCGYAGDEMRPCRCTPDQIQCYLARISGPILDRIDLQITLTPLPPERLVTPTDQQPENSTAIRARVNTARAKQQERQGCANARLEGLGLKRYCQLDEKSQQCIAEAMSRLQLSARAYHKILRVARTLADMQNREAISLAHVQEALSYRSKPVTQLAKHWQ